MSSRSIAAMERGPARGPRPRSVEQLAAALELAGAEREEFVAAGRALFWASRAPHHGDEHDGGAHNSDKNNTRVHSGGAAGEVPCARQLPADLPDFVGRGAELALLRSLLEPAGHSARLAVLSGPAGVGKTALAVHVGHLLAPCFPDGQLYAGLRGTSADPADPAEVLAQLLRGLGVAGAALPVGLDARGGLFRDRVAGRRVLVVLDDAGGYRQVEPLLPVSDVAVLVTSRLPLTGLPGVTFVDLGPLPGSAAVELLCQVAGDDRVQAEPAAAAELVSACGGLPLAVRIAGARLAARPHWTVETLNQRLADERRRLDELSHADLAVRPSLQLCHQALTPVAARAFTLLGELGTSFPEWVVAAFLGSDPASGAAVLEELLDTRLLEVPGPDPAGQPRYRFHEITRLYARERRQIEVGPAEWKEALARAAGGWLALARQAQDNLHCLRLGLDDRTVPARITDPRVAALAVTRPVEWFEAEQEALAALGRACAEAGLAALARCLAGCCADFQELRGYYDGWQRAMRTARTACRRAGDRAGEAAMSRGLGTCLNELDEPDAAISALTAARELSEEIGDRAGAALAGHEIGYVLGLTGRLDEAESELHRAAEGFARAGLPLRKAVTLTALGFILRQRGDTGAAVDILRSAMDIARSGGEPFTEAYVLRGLSGALLACGRAEEAEWAARRSAMLFDWAGDPIGTAQSLRALGEALSHAPDPPAGDPVPAEGAHRLALAAEAIAEAAAIFRRCGHRWGLALTELSLGEIEARQGVPEAAARLRRSLQYWTSEQVPALQARTLVALASIAEAGGDRAARDLLRRAYELYRDLASPVAADLAARLGLTDGAPSPP